MKTRKMLTLLYILMCASLFLLPAAPAAARQPIPQPAQDDATYVQSWPMYAHDPAHTGRSPANGPNSPDVKWVYTADGNVSSPVVGTDGSIYFTTSLGWYQGQMIALNADGTLRWKLDAGDGHMYYPTIGRDGTVYVVKNPTNTDDFLLALNPLDGTTLWSFALGQDSIGTGATFGSNSRPLVGLDGTIYKASAFGKDGYGTLYAINPDGTLKWSWDTSADAKYCGDSKGLIYCSIESTPALAPNGTLYLKPYGQGMIAFDSATGAYLWRNDFAKDAGGADPFGQTLTVGGDNVAYTTEGGGRYNFYAVNPNNTVKWVVRLKAWNDAAVSPITADGTLVMRGDNDANFYGLNTADGSIRWSLSELAPGGFFDGAPVLSANGIIYFTTGETTGTPEGTPGYLFAVRVDTGEILWKYQVGFSAEDLAMGADGTLFVPAKSNGKPALYAFQCADGQCTLPQPPCPDPTHITNESDLSNCIQQANVLPGTQTLGLDANITLHQALPNIITDIVLNGNGHFISGGSTLQVFNLVKPGGLALNAITLQDGMSIRGGAIINSGGTVTITNSTLKNNTARYYGGGAIFNNGTMTVVNSTFSGNLSMRVDFSITTSGYGGAISNDSSGNLSVLNSTFSDNSTYNFSGSGGAISNGGVLYLKNTILANSTGENDCASYPALAPDASNLIQRGSSCGAPIQQVDPKLGPLADNGGPTQTMALLPGSPARDAGDDAICAGEPVNNLDQRGVSRPLGDHCDIGAYEAVFIPVPPPPPTYHFFLPALIMQPRYW